MATIAETNVERGAFICSRCEQQTMKLIDCLCESCNRAVGKQLKTFCKYCHTETKQSYTDPYFDCCRDCWREHVKDKPEPAEPQTPVYRTNPIDSILSLWEGVLEEKRAQWLELRGEIGQLTSCIEGLKRNLK